MIRIIGTEAVQFVEQLPGDHLGRSVFHPVDHPVPHRRYRRETLLILKPIQQEDGWHTILSPPPPAVHRPWKLGVSGW
jgi:hypothetical protein